MTPVVTCQSQRTSSVAFLIIHCTSPVYEYPLNGQWIMMDVDDGYILWTGIWKGKLPFIFWLYSMHDSVITSLVSQP